MARLGRWSWSLSRRISSRTQPGLTGVDYCLGTIGYLQLGEDARNVIAYRFGAEVEARGDGVVGVALGHEGEDFVLPLGQVRERLVRSRSVVPSRRGEVAPATPFSQSYHAVSERAMHA